MVKADTMKVFLAVLFASLGLTLASAACPECASDETCNSSTEKCDCILATYNETDLPPFPSVNCNNGTMNIYISKCQLEKSKYNSSNLHLNDTACVGTGEIQNGLSQIAFHQTLKTGECKNKVIMNDTHVTFYNTLYISPQISNVVARKYVNMSFSCSFPVKFNIALGPVLKPVIGSTQISAPGTDSVFTLNMIAFKDDEFTQVLTAEHTLYVEDTIYISVLVPNLEANTFAVRVVSIYASASVNPATGPNYNLLSNGCPDKTINGNLLKVIKNGNGSEARFAMKVFKIASSDFVNLFANVTLCQDSCVPDCSSRSVDFRADNLATLSVSLTAEEIINVSGAFNRFSMAWTLILLIMSFIFVNLM
ncbi:uromodulin-like [Spea bombifrons]|uniref:uromodulin-like n=1 Tax=Spea bombifrons TaxID=233779 RepID=UPI002349E1F9|nr:uromodulin-like [Spea bombifrons]